MNINVHARKKNIVNMQETKEFAFSFSHVLYIGIKIEEIPPSLKYLRTYAGNLSEPETASDNELTPNTAD